MGLKDLMGSLADGIGHKKRQKMGPLGEAILTLRIVKDQMKASGSSSATMKSLEVVLDALYKHRLALNQGVLVVNTLVDEDLAKDPKKHQEALAQACSAFQVLAVGARLEQDIP